MMNITFAKVSAGKYTATKNGERIAGIEKLAAKCWRVFTQIGAFDFETLTEAKSAVESGRITY